MRDKKRKKWFLFGLAGTAIVGLAVFLFWRQSTLEAKETTYHPVKVSLLSKDVVEGANFILSGVVKPNNLKTISLDAKRGKVLETLVQEGDQVTEGQELFRYVSLENDFEIKQAQLDVENNEKAVNQKKEDANFKWGRYHERVAELNTIKSKLTKASEEEKATLQEEKNTKDEAVHQSLEEARIADSETKNAQLDLEKANLNLTAVQQKYGDNVVRSEINGQVLKIAKDQLDTVVSSDAKAFMQIADQSSYYVAGTVDEFRKKQLQLDQAVEILDRSQSKQKWTGKISRIEQLSSEEDAEQKEDENPNASKYPYRAVLTPSETKPALDQNVYVVVRPLNQAEGIYLPLDYLKKENGQWFVWVVVKGKLQQKKVEVEVRTELQLGKVTAGLTGEESVLPAEAGLRAGMEVD